MNERNIIEIMMRSGGKVPPGLLRGIGDDCAVMVKDERSSLLVTMDTLVESVHFDLEWHPPEKLGRKAVNVNVSDIAAMGGEPVYVFLSIGLPQGFDPLWVKKFSRGIASACGDHGCMLVGGDTVRSREGVLITITVIGEIPADEVVYRSGAMPADTIWVSGELGMAAAGLEICRRRGEGETGSYETLVNAHLDPRARVELGRLLAGSNVVHSMMDLSDGLATDLSHMCTQSSVGAVIHSAKLPCAPVLKAAAAELQCDPVDLMLKGGEDYELLFTTGPGVDKEILACSAKAGVPVVQIGTVDDQQGVRLLRPVAGSNEHEAIDVSYGGYDHFPEK